MTNKYKKTLQIGSIEQFDLSKIRAVCIISIGIFGLYIPIFTGLIIIGYGLNLLLRGEKDAI